MEHNLIDKDLLVIGGGINGAGIAADAAGRGLSVMLCEKSDLAAATSSASTKLIHGGLRYLEQYEFGLVRKSLAEREVLINAAPHIVRPIPIHIPLLPHSRNPWLIRTGLFLYDHLSRRRRFRGSRLLRIDPETSPLKESISRVFEYWDGATDDARLVMCNVLQAARHKAEILTRTEVTEIESCSEGFRVKLKNLIHNRTREVVVRGVVNATGPWAEAMKNKLASGLEARKLRLVRGSHIVVPRLYNGVQSYLLQHDDGRVIFVIPYLRNFTLIGTTERDYQGDPDAAEISKDETRYLIAIVNHYFRKSILESNVLHTFSGVRPLIDEEGKSARVVSRDYELRLEHQPQPFLSVYGGKLTTYRVLAEQAVDKLREYYPQMGPAWTRKAVLPGGDFDLSENLFRDIATRYPWLGPELITRWQHSYGTLAFEIVGDAHSMADLGEDFGEQLYKKEVDYLWEKEWARTAEDILWRRTKLGYQFSDKQREALDQYLARRRARS